MWGINRDSLLPSLGQHVVCQYQWLHYGQNGHNIGEGGGPLWALPSLLFVVLGIASAAVNNKRGHLASGVYVLLVVIWILVEMAGGTRGSFFEVIGIGLWITLVAAIGQIVGAFMLFDEMGEPIGG